MTMMTTSGVVREVEQYPIRVTPEKATEMLREWAFDGQRRIDKLRVSSYAQQMREGKWNLIEPITVAIAERRRYLVNGYSRLTAVVEANQPVTMLCTVARVDDEGAVRKLYAAFDTGIRTHKQNIAASGAMEDMGLSLDTTQMLSGATPYLIAGFAPTEAWKIASRRSDLRVATVREWAAAGVEYAELIGESNRSPIARALRKAPIAAVALTTLRHQPEMARSFWGRLAGHDFDKDGAYWALYEYLRDVRTASGRSFLAAKGAALGWNAHVDGRVLKMIRVDGDLSTHPVVIKGTPVGARSR